MQYKSDPRHNSRVLALQKLFQKEFQQRHPQENEGVSLYPEESIIEINELDNFDNELTSQLVDQMPIHQNEIDTIIQDLAPEWPIANIAFMDLLILRLAILEGFILKKTPQKVVINEAIELTKDFCNEQTRKFISGVLGTLYTNQDKYLKYP